MAHRSDPPSDLVAISRLNGEFKKNYGTLLGAYLYLRSLHAAGGRSYFWSGLIVATHHGRTELVRAAWLEMAAVAQSLLQSLARRIVTREGGARVAPQDPRKRGV